MHRPESDEWKDYESLADEPCSQGYLCSLGCRQVVESSASVKLLEDHSGAVAVPALTRLAASEQVQKLQERYQAVQQKMSKLRRLRREHEKLAEELQQVRGAYAEAQAQLEKLRKEHSALLKDAAKQRDLEGEMARLKGEYQELMAEPHFRSETGGGSFLRAGPEHGSRGLGLGGLLWTPHFGETGAVQDIPLSTAGTAMTKLVGNHGYGPFTKPGQAPRASQVPAAAGHFMSTQL
eukprot:s3969_g6.t1